jgi:asparagine synthase (glutamine-hydrolysing)
LKNWLHDLLLDPKTLERGYFRRSGIEKLLAGNGRSGDFAKELFSLAVLELWHRQFIDRTVARDLSGADIPELAARQPTESL